MRQHAIFGFAAVWILCIAAQPAAAEVWNKNWAIAGPAQVRLDADDGNIRVETGASSQVKAFIRTIGWRIAEDEVRVIERQSGGKVEIEVRLPRGEWNWRLRREIHIELTVPARADLDLHTGDGNITTHGTEGQLSSHTGDGNITAVGAKGTIRLHTGDGNINADELEGAVTAETGDGNLIIAGRFDTVDFRTGDGNVEVTTYAGSRVASPWKIRTGDGNIVVRLPEGVTANLDADTGDGRVTCDFPVTIPGGSRPTTFRGPMNGGGAPLSIHTGDGNIRIEKR